MAEEGTPRILVEGGPFWRHTRYTLWFLLGCIVGVVIAFIIAFHSIQQSRFDQCEATNRRNKATVVTLEHELSVSPLSQKKRNQALTQTIALINDLDPIRNCKEVVY